MRAHGSTRPARWAAVLFAAVALLFIAFRRPRAAAVPIDAPIAGRFTDRLANGALLVRAGDHVTVGRPIGIIEGNDGMQNEIVSPLAGRVVRLTAANGQHVAAGDPLFLVEPKRPCLAPPQPACRQSTRLHRSSARAAPPVSTATGGQHLPTTRAAR